MTEISALTLKQFLLRFWIWHFAVTCTFLLLVELIVHPHIAAQQATHRDLIIILGCLLLSIVHTILILIFSMRRFSNKENKAGLVYLVHFFCSASMAYFIGALFTRSVFQNVMPG